MNTYLDYATTDAPDASKAAMISIANAMGLEVSDKESSNSGNAYTCMKVREDGKVKKATVEHTDVPFSLSKWVEFCQAAQG